MKPWTRAGLLVACVLLVHAQLSQAKGGRGGGGFKGGGSKSTGGWGWGSKSKPSSTSNRKPSVNTRPAASVPRHPPNPPGGYGHGGHGGVGGGGYRHYPVGGGGYRYYPAGGGGAGAQGAGYPERYHHVGGGVGGVAFGGGGGYPAGGYMNRNPNNRILSPQYGGSYGYGGYGGGAGSPFSRSVQSMGVAPGQRSRGFGRNAALAAAGGAVAGVALGYGLGRFPRPHFQFHNQQEALYYNHYMYRRYGAKSTDANDYSRDYRLDPAPVSYDAHMNACMNRSDLLAPAGGAAARGGGNATDAAVATGGGPSNSSLGAESVANPAPAENKTNAVASPPGKERPEEAAPSKPRLPPPPPARRGDGEEEDEDDTVSMVEIGYPALVEQLKARECVRRYMEYSGGFMRQVGGAGGGAGGGLAGRSLRESLALAMGAALLLLLL